MLMPIVPTPKDHSTARVIRGTLEMESRVLVKHLLLATFKLSVPEIQI